MKIIFIFSCSGMFRDVPECSMFQVLSTPEVFQSKFGEDLPFANDAIRTEETEELTK